MIIWTQISSDTHKTWTHSHTQSKHSHDTHTRGQVTSTHKCTSHTHTDGLREKAVIAHTHTHAPCLIHTDADLWHIQHKQYDVFSCEVTDVNFNSIMCPYFHPSTLLPSSSALNFKVSKGSFYHSLHSRMCPSSLGLMPRFFVLDQFYLSSFHTELSVLAYLM